MALHISFSIFSSLWDRISMSLLIFCWLFGHISGWFQIRMPQKTAYGLDGYTVREQHGGGVRMPGHMIGQP